MIITVCGNMIESQAIYEMYSASGVECTVDAALVSAVRAKMKDDPIGDDDYQICCLLIVFAAVSLGKLARTEATTFKATLSAHVNNSHCIARAINSVTNALFTRHNRGDVAERMKEFFGVVLQQPPTHGAVRREQRHNARQTKRVFTARHDRHPIAVPHR